MTRFNLFASHNYIYKIWFAHYSVVNLLRLVVFGVKSVYELKLYFFNKLVLTFCILNIVFGKNYTAHLTRMFIIQDIVLVLSVVYANLSQILTFEGNHSLKFSFIKEKWDLERVDLDSNKQHSMVENFHYHPEINQKSAKACVISVWCW